jgi:midasin (ATPase involved in ribosome maturation)
MDLLMLAIRVILKKRLHVFPTVQSTDSSDALDLYHVVETGAIAVPIHGALHMRGFDFASLHHDGTRGVDDALRYV